MLAQQPHLDPARAIAVASQLSERAVQLRFRKYPGFSAAVERCARWASTRRNASPRPKCRIGSPCSTSTAITMRAANGSTPATGTSYARFGEDGRLTQMTSFLDSEPAQK